MTNTDSVDSSARSGKAPMDGNAYPWTFNGPPMTEENATARLSEMLVQVAEFMGNFPVEAKQVDARAWEILLIYGPKPDPVLCKFYNVTKFPELVAIQAHHIERLQAMLPPSGSLAPQRVREG
jgi:hypothetical protein